MTQFIGYDSNKAIHVVFGRPDVDGPPEPTPDPHDGLTFAPWQGFFMWGESPSPTSVYEWTDAGPAWVEHGDVDMQRDYKIAAMSQSCANAIVSGFLSSALGAAHTYPAKTTDQTNLSGSIIASILPGNDAGWITPFWCADADGIWDFRMHSAAQIQQVGRDAKSAVLACMTVNEQLRAQIMQSSIEQLPAIVWPTNLQGN